MSRLMSVALTEDAVVSRRKTVTRRPGWSFLRPGDRLTLCRKARGRKPGEPLVRLAEVEVVDVRRERLWDMDPADVAREGVPAHVYARNGHDAACRDCGVVSWTAWYSRVMGLGGDDGYVTRIEWRYLDDPLVAP